MSERHLFVADVHLRREEAGKRRAFIRLLDDHARPDVHLWVLGDLFDLWIGSVQIALEPEWRELFDAFARFVDAGAKLTFFHGNRDYCMGRYLTRTLGAETVAVGKTLELDGRRVHLTHGDMLCTGDQAYTLLRALVRGPLFDLFWSCVPARWKVGLSGIYRSASLRHVPDREEARHGLSRTALRRLVRRDVELLICGHIHRPIEGRFRRGDRELEVRTLPAWEDRGAVLEYADGRFALLSVDFA